ncbi:hypothetical protein ABLN73_01275, partial [Mycobacterium tuberculosis]
MSELAAVLTRSMQASAGDLMVLDRETSLWCRHPWPEVHGLAESVAAWLLDHDRPAAVGLVGEPTVELVAAIQGAWLAGAAVSILPGPVRGANDQRWADATLTRFLGIGVRTVLSQGSYLARLRSVDTAGVTIGDLSTKWLKWRTKNAKGFTINAKHDVVGLLLGLKTPKFDKRNQR